MEKKIFDAEIKVGGTPKQVVIFKVAQTISRGTVGTAKFYWDSGKADAPRVTIKNDTYQNGHGVCIMARNYLYAAKEEMLRARNASPLQVNTTPIEEREELVSASASERLSSEEETKEDNMNYISGCSKWLRKYKKWTPCRTANGTTYMRRTHFDFSIPGAKELVTKYLNYCSKCHERTVCESPCDNPEVRSSEKHFE